MIYRDVRPRVELAPFVRCIWLMRGAASAAARAPQRIVPDGCIELIFNLGEPFRRVNESGGADVQPNAMVVGATTRHLHVWPAAEIDLVGIRLRPGALPLFSRVRAHEFSDATLEAPFVLEGAATLHDRLCQTVATPARVALVEQHLTRVAARRPSAPRTAALAAQIVHGAGVVSCSGVARSAGLSHRQLDRLFAAEVGIAPRVLGRLARFQRALWHLEPGRFPGWAAVAARAGYFDQAHLIRDFVEFSGVTPAAYAREQHPMSDAFSGVAS